MNVIERLEMGRKKWDLKSKPICQVMMHRYITNAGIYSRDKSIYSPTATLSQTLHTEAENRGEEDYNPQRSNSTAAASKLSIAFTFRQKEDRLSISIYAEGENKKKVPC